jgi:chromate transporter
MSVNMPETGAQEPQQPEPKVAPSLSELFIAFLRLGATAFGGPAMVAYIREMAVGRKGWMDGRAFDDGVALCQTVPGATAMQTAAYVGLRLRGMAGAAASFVGFGLPAFGLMLVLSAAYARTHNLPTVVSAFSGLQAMVVAIAANAAVSFGKTTLKHWRHVLITAMAVALFGWGLNPILVVALSGLLGFWLLSDRPSAGPAENVPAPRPHTMKPVIFILCATVATLGALFLLNRQLGELAAMMVRIDLFAFGGGFASVPLLFNEVVTARQWLDGPTLLDGIVLGQVTPGPIVITATFVGYMLHGMTGAVVATFGVFTPSFLIVVAAAPRFDSLRASPVFGKLINGALCSFPGLLLIVTVHFAQSVSWNIPRVVLAGAALVALRLGTNILWVVIAGTGLSLLFR